MTRHAWAPRVDTYAVWLEQHVVWVVDVRSLDITVRTAGGLEFPVMPDELSRYHGEGGG